MSYIHKPKKFRFKLSDSLFALFISAFLTLEAHAEGLEKAKGVLDLIKTEILSIVPVIAVIALISLGIGYALNSVQKETFMRWGAGLIIVGSAAQITSMLLS